MLKASLTESYPDPILYSLLSLRSSKALRSTFIVASFLVGQIEFLKKVLVGDFWKMLTTVDLKSIKPMPESDTSQLVNHNV